MSNIPRCPVRPNPLVTLLGQISDANLRSVTEPADHACADDDCFDVMVSDALKDATGLTAKDRCQASPLAEVLTPFTESELIVVPHGDPSLPEPPAEVSLCEVGPKVRPLLERLLPPSATSVSLSLLRSALDSPSLSSRETDYIRFVIDTRFQPKLDSDEIRIPIFANGRAGQGPGSEVVTAALVQNKGFAGYADGAKGRATIMRTMLTTQRIELEAPPGCRVIRQQGQYNRPIVTAVDALGRAQFKAMSGERLKVWIVRPAPNGDPGLPTLVARFICKLPGNQIRAGGECTVCAP